MARGDASEKRWNELLETGGMNINRYTDTSRGITKMEKAASKLPKPTQEPEWVVFAPM